MRARGNKPASRRLTRGLQNRYSAISETINRIIGIYKYTRETHTHTHVVKRRCTRKKETRFVQLVFSVVYGPDENSFVGTDRSLKQICIHLIAPGYLERVLTQPNAQANAFGRDNRDISRLPVTEVSPNPQFITRNSFQSTARR